MKCVFITAMVIYTITIQAVPCFYDNISSYHPAVDLNETNHKVFKYFTVLLTSFKAARFSRILASALFLHTGRCVAV